MNSPKDVIRHAAREGLIDAPERWFLFLELRNLTSHTYDEGVANRIVSHLADFQNKVGLLIHALRQP